MNGNAVPSRRTISVFLADDNLIVREGVRALINRSPDLEVIGVAADYDEVIAGYVDEVKTRILDLIDVGQQSVERAILVHVQ